MEDYILVIGKEETAQFRGDEEVRKQSVSVDKLKAELGAMAKGLGQILTDITKIGDFQLEEATFKVEISCEGKMSLLGTGVSTSALGSVELKFCKPKEK